MEGPGLGRRGREAGLLTPLVFVKAVGGEKISRCGGSPSTRRARWPLAPRVAGLFRFAGKFNAGHVGRPARGALHLSAVMARLFGPSIGKDRCRIKRGYIGCDGPPSGGPVPG